MDLYVFPILILPPVSLPIPSLWVFPVYQARAFVSCIQPGLVICFTLDWYIYTMEYYSAIKKNSFESVLMRWMKLEPIIQSEVSQKDKDQITFKIKITPPPGMSDMMKGMGANMVAPSD